MNFCRNMRWKIWKNTQMTENWQKRHSSKHFWLFFGRLPYVRPRCCFSNYCMLILGWSDMRPSTSVGLISKWENVPEWPWKRDAYWVKSQKWYLHFILAIFDKNGIQKRSFRRRSLSKWHRKIWSRAWVLWKCYLAKRLKNF